MSQRQRAWEPESHETTTHSPTTETSLSLITPQQETQPKVEGHNIEEDEIISGEFSHNNHLTIIVLSIRHIFYGR
jgi:hypothetical protein